MLKYVMIRTTYITLMEICAVEIGQKKRNFASQHTLNHNQKVAI